VTTRSAHRRIGWERRAGAEPLRREGCTEGNHFVGL
jgi:hypothetical protein